MAGDVDGGTKIDRVLAIVTREPDLAAELIASRVDMPVGVVRTVLSRLVTRGILLATGSGHQSDSRVHYRRA